MLILKMMLKATLTVPAYIDPENVTKTGNVTLTTGIGNTTANKTVISRL